MKYYEVELSGNELEKLYADKDEFYMLFDKAVGSSENYMSETAKALCNGLFDGNIADFYEKLADCYEYGITSSYIANFQDSLYNTVFKEYKDEISKYCENTDCLDCMAQGGWIDIGGQGALFSILFDESVKARVVQGIFYDLAIALMESEVVNEMQVT